MKKNIFLFMKSIPMCIYALIFCVGHIMAAHQELELRSPERRIASVVKSTFSGKDDKEAYLLMAKHLMQLRLVDHLGRWASPYLEQRKEELLPSRVSFRDFAVLVDQMATLAEKNPYLHQAALEAQECDLGDLYSKIRTEGQRVIPGVIAYAMVINKLTYAMRNDHNTLRIVHKILQGERGRTKNTKDFGWFEHIKFRLIDRTVDRILNQHERGEVDPNWTRWGLPANILEAVSVDLMTRNFMNAYAGLVLARSRPGGLKDLETGAGPANFSVDRKAIELHMPFEKQWADLYTTWNLSFLLRYTTHPYIIMKLLIPQVNDYGSAPGEYIYNRIIALHLTFHFFLFGDAEGCVNFRSFDWRSPTLSGVFSRVSFKGARHYQQLAASSRPLPCE